MYIAIEDTEKNDDVSHLIKNGTVYRDEKPMYKKYDFDGERIRANLYNKYCPNCKRYFHTIGKMAVIDIDKVVIIYSLEHEIYRFDFDFHDNNHAKYTCKHNYVCIDKM